MKSLNTKQFYKLSPQERLTRIQEAKELSDDELLALQKCGLSLDQANRMIENVVGTLEIPVGIAVNFLVNNREYTIPMAIEEASVVAASCKMAKIALIKGGFHTNHTAPVMIGQIQVTNVADPFAAKMRILQERKRLLELANQQDPILVGLGGGACDLEVKVLDTASGPMVICHLLVNCKDAMGANAVNTMAEALAPEIEKIAKGKVYLRIISNLATKRMARAYAVFDADALGGEDVVDGMVLAYEFADADPYRAATHNKGIMNGISAVALALGQDTRAIEAGAHAYASQTGRYRSLTKWEKNVQGDLVGSIELPMAVGLVGGAVNVHPTVKTNLKILGIKNANQLGSIIAAVGLAQNAGAMRALASEGIQKGHMSLHARNIAVMAGASPEIVDTVVEKLVATGKVRVDVAQQIIKELV
ncbi:hydroxymethylglutaryl-CoA reductase, degradative [Candidatus Uabimicrobium amorphum]|uniref:3-hydroxy-3-methylglutaryl coenzyme A reductase n=1 Tax=Uabimicrobium amorphum TaxID=2596890 RepID=A0A5S9IKT2_UABAM|nr:hydroxymethylglutaryl-CoA reductase, degradative [Candidatus Uabimicrobium amorphum]BBM83534.1 3-hydroxy-3-methylglutaryl coenzyme A reductase [Candidatus Uabimicrobium amorphum]